MIKVYIFVTGLVLYQLPATPGGSTFAVLAAGGYDYPELARIESHKVSFYPREDPNKPLKRPVEARFKAPCPRTGCPGITEPPNFPNVADVVVADGIHAKIQPGCISFDEDAECRPADLKDVSGRNGLLEFAGSWSLEGMTDCGGDAYPSRSLPLAKLNFVRARRAWEVLLDEPLEVGSTLLFSTVVESMDDLEVSDEELRDYLSGTKSSDCTGMPDFEESGAEECVAVVIRNGPEHSSSRGGDLHYAALHGLLQDRQDAADLWLPMGVDAKVCPDDGGGSQSGAVVATAGMTGCTGGFLPGN